MRVPKGRIALLAVLLVAGAAQAEPINVGLFAPSAPFPSTAARVELASRLGEHLGTGLGGTGMGRVYARAGDFAAAVKKGEITLALVDSAYLASTSGYTVIASGLRGGEANQGWQLVARGATKLAELKGKRVLVPSNGGRETDFVLNVLFGGEVSRDFFGKLEPAPDTTSALAALGLAKADAAIVPVGVELPGGVAVVLALGTLTGPTLVAYGTLSPQQRTALVAAAGSFKGDATVGGFRASDGDAVRSIARRFSVQAKRGPLVVPSVRLVVGDLVGPRTFAIERTPPTAFASNPAPR